MNTSSEFFTYFKSRIDYYSFHDLEKELNETKKLFNLITPTIGSPFKFFIWFFSRGFNVYYDEYWKNLPFIHSEGEEFNLANDQWTYHVEGYEGKIERYSYDMIDDLKALLNEEFGKVIYIYEQRWNLSLNKEEYRRVVRDDLIYIEREFRIDDEISFPNKAIGEITTEWSKKFVPRLKEEITTLTQNYFGEIDSAVPYDTPRKNAFNNKSEVRRKKGDVFIITTHEAESLYNLTITKEEPNLSLINIDESSESFMFQKILSTYDHGITDAKFKFNCQTKYVAFIFKWIQTNRHFNFAFPALERMNCFYTNTNTPINSNSLNEALNRLSKSLAYKKFLKRNTTEINSVTPDSSAADILNYLSSQLSKIFLVEN